MRLLDEIRIAYCSVNDMGDVAEHPATVERAMIAAVSTARTGRRRADSSAWASGSSEPSWKSATAVGEDTEAVLRSLGLATESI